MKSKSLFAPVLLIVLGLALLLHKQGYLPNLGHLLAEWWPLILVGLGVSMLVQRLR